MVHIWVSKTHTEFPSLTTDNRATANNLQKKNPYHDEKNGTLRIHSAEKL